MERPVAGAGPLEGLKVLELGQLVAAPFCTRLLAEFGADVVKVEAPKSGDPLREWRVMENGTSLWWHVQSRNKKSITLDLRNKRGQEVAFALAAEADILVENFRPGTLEKWGLDPERLLEANPGLVIIRISGFGQTGPYRERPGFGSVAEAMGGIRYVTGYPDRPPVRSNLSLGDSLAGLYAAYAAVTAVLERKQSGRGQVVDVALYEAVFGLMEGLIPEYDRKGYRRERHGNSIPGVAPQGTYTCKDGRYAVIGGNADNVYKRLMEAIGRPDLAADPRFATNAGRAKEEQFLDQVISEWCGRHTLDEALAVLERAEVPSGPIYTAAEMVADPHFAARGMIESLDVPGMGPVKLPGIVPKFSRTPGQTRWAGPALGAHTEEVMEQWLGLSGEEIAGLREQGVM